MEVKLRVLLGKSTGKDIDIPVPRFLIGRSDDCHLRPKSESVSRNHCAILSHENDVVVRDLNSKNGTYVNDEKVTGECPLRDGDRLRVGKLEFQVVITGQVVAAKPPQEEAPAAASPVAESQAQSETERGEATVAVPTTKAPTAPEPSSTDSTSGEFDITSWLAEADAVEEARRRSDPDTRQFNLTEADRQKLQDAAASAEGDDTGETKKARPEKKPPGKLPPRPSTNTATSRDAAAEMLKKYFRNR